MGGEEKRPSPRRWIVLAALLLAVVAFVLPPLVNISRYQHRIADAIGRSIGRPVHISSVKLRLLPLPGFEFSDFSVKKILTSAPSPSFTPAVSWPTCDSCRYGGDGWKSLGSISMMPV